MDHLFLTLTDDTTNVKLHRDFSAKKIYINFFSIENVPQSGSYPTDIYWNIDILNNGSTHTEGVRTIIRNDDLISFPIPLVNSAFMHKSYEQPQLMFNLNVPNFRSFTIKITRPDGSAAQFDKMILSLSIQN